MKRRTRITIWLMFMGMITYTLNGCQAASGFGKDLANVADYLQHGLDNGFDHGGTFKRID